MGCNKLQTIAPNESTSSCGDHEIPGHIMAESGCPLGSPWIHANKSKAIPAHNSNDWFTMFIGKPGYKPAMKPLL